MGGFRAFTPLADMPSGTFILDPDESHHLINVRRAKTGQSVELINGQGKVAQSTLILADRRKAQLEIRSVETIAPPSIPLTLAQAIPKGKTMDAVIQRATELGVSRIIPLKTDYSEVSLNEARTHQKISKWRQIAIESIKQSGNPHLPIILTPQTIEQTLKGTEALHLNLVAALTQHTIPIRQAIRTHQKPTSITLFIGPEGDFSPTEYHLMESENASFVTLGNLVMRVETAACASIALILDALRESNEHLESGF